MNNILIIGGGDLAKQINHHLSGEPYVSVVGFVDDTLKFGQTRFEKKCVGALKDIPTLFANKAFDQLICGIGYKHLNFRKKLFESLRRYSFYTFVHNNAITDKSAKLASMTLISKLLKGYGYKGMYIR